MLKSNQSSRGVKKRLACASERLKNDHDIVLTAVTSEGSALHHASKRLQDDQGIVLAAVTSDGAALAYASEVSVVSTCSAPPHTHSSMIGGVDAA